MSILDKQKQRSKPEATGDFLIADDSFAEEYPGLFEMIARCKYQGKSRKTGRLIMFAEPDRATICLCDQDSSQVAFYAAETFGEALAGLERALQAGTADWRLDKKAQYRR